SLLHRPAPQLPPGAALQRLHEGLVVQHLLPEQREPVRHYQRPPSSVQTLGEQLRGDEVAGASGTRDALLLCRHHQHHQQQQHAHQEHLRHG
ncbi:hypothetical protein XENORESO_017692, partial [Xenotaenia resolanae]